MGHVKAHYYRSHDDINPTGFVPVGPELDWTASHTRDERSKTTARTANNR